MLFQIPLTTSRLNTWKYTLNFTRLHDTTICPSLVVHSVQVNLQIHKIKISRCTVICIWSPLWSQSINWTHHFLQSMYNVFPIITFKLAWMEACRRIYKSAWSWPSSTFLSLSEYNLRLHISVHPISAFTFLLSNPPGSSLCWLKSHHEVFCPVCEIYSAARFGEYTNVDWLK